MNIRRATGRAAVIMLLAVCVTGCFKRPSRGAAESANRRITVQVENNHWSTVVIYAVINGQNIRIGEVNTGATADLLTPVGVDPSVVNFRLRVDPIGQREVFDTGSISLQGGSRILLTVENDLRNSRVRIT